MSLDMEAIEARCDEATPGPWLVVAELDGDEMRVERIIGPDDADGYERQIVETDSGYYPPKFHDAEFIAHAREDVPALLALVRELRVENSELRAALYDARGPSVLNPEAIGVDQSGVSSDILDEIRCRAAGYSLAADADIHALINRIRYLEGRQESHLATIRSLSQSVPLDSEVSEALNQRGALLAEVGTLKSGIAEKNAVIARSDRACVEALAELASLRAKVEAMEAVLGWLDRGGGLGADTHRKIRAVTGKKEGE